MHKTNSKKINHKKEREKKEQEETGNSASLSLYPSGPE